jgi:hypothetical protein
MHIQSTYTSDFQSSLNRRKRAITTDVWILITYNFLREVFKKNIFNIISTYLYIDDL